MIVTIEEAEKIILDEVKFINFILEEARARSARMKEKLGMSYAKFTGITTAYERFIPVCRDIKRDTDEYLKQARLEIERKYRAENLQKRNRREYPRPGRKVQEPRDRPRSSKPVREEP